MIRQPELRLITIPVSHYCEKARWALERAGLPYREIRHIQFLHYVSTLLHAGSLFAPVLLAPGETVKDSTDILRFVDRHSPPELALFPADPALAARVAAWEERFDATIGIEVRRWMYHVGFEQLGENRMIALAAQGVPSWQPRVAKALMVPARAYLRARLRVNESTVQAGIGIVREVFDEVAQELGTRRYLVGDRFTAADLTFAALASFVLMPEEYGVRLPSLEELPDAMRQTVASFRNHPAGRYALRLYREDRQRAATPVS